MPVDAVWMLGSRPMLGSSPSITKGGAGGRSHSRRRRPHHECHKHWSNISLRSPYCCTILHLVSKSRLRPRDLLIRILVRVRSPNAAVGLPTLPPDGWFSSRKNVCETQATACRCCRCVTRSCWLCGLGMATQRGLWIQYPSPTRWDLLDYPKGGRSTPVAVHATGSQGTSPTCSTCAVHLARGRKRFRGSGIACHGGR